MSGEEGDVTPRGGVGGGSIVDEAPKSDLDGRKAEGEEQHGRNESSILFIGHGGEREGGRKGVQDMAGRLLADPRPWLTGLGPPDTRCNSLMYTKQLSTR